MKELSGVADLKTQQANVNDGDRIECPDCGVPKLPSEFSSIEDCCSSCEVDRKSKRKSDEWAELRAKGRAAFVRHDSGAGIPYTRGKPVMQCLNCDSFLTGEKVINQHAKRCRRK